MARGESEAARLRRCRLMFERGYAGMAPGVAQNRLRLDEIEERRREIETIRRCGRPAEAAQADTAAEAPARPFYWQEGQYE